MHLPATSILLADCDAMFCAVARLVDPEGAGRAPLLLVGGSPEGRGVVCSASYETRSFGVQSGMSMAEALRLCPGAMVVPVPRGVCAEKSREVRTVLREWAPVVEPASIDEFYLSMTGTETLYRGESVARTAERIRTDVRRRTGLEVSIGGGTNRLVAKLAVEQAKPHRGGHGVLVINPGEEAPFVAGLALAAIPGIGPRFQEKLERHGMVMVRDALRFDRVALANLFGVRTGHWLYDRIRGKGSTEVHARDDAKSMGREETFPRDLSTDEELARELIRLTDRLAQDLRRAGLSTRTITVKLRDADFTTRSAARTIDCAVRTREAIHPVAADLLRRLRSRRAMPVRLLGVSASRLQTHSGSDQLSLFASATQEGDSERHRALSETVDRIRTRFGNRAIQPARLTPAPDESPSS